MKRALGIVLLLAGCGGLEQVDATLATLTPVRGETRLGEIVSPPLARAGAQRIRTAEGSLARLALDDGPDLLLDASTDIELHDASSLRIHAGRVYAAVEAGDRLAIDSDRGSLRASDAAFSVELRQDGVHVYVVRGEVSYSSGAGAARDRGIAGAGEELVLAEHPSRGPATLWQDWTGGLARPGPVDAQGPEGMGTLEARVPEEVGLARWPLVVRRLDVRVRVAGDLAVTEVDQLFFNPASETVEGLYRIRVPEGAVLQRFAVDRDNRLVDGYVREREQARQAYQVQVYRGSTEDPALLEWDAPGSYRARIYPIVAGETRRIVIRYVEWLHAPAAGAPRLYRYPMGGGARAPHVQEFGLAVDVSQAGAASVRAGMEAQVEEGTVRVRRSDFRPRADFWMELAGGDTVQHAWTAPHEPPPRAPNAPAATNEADERPYFYLPLILPTSIAGEGQHGGPRDLVIVADVSAGTDRSHLELGRSVVESITAHLSHGDRVAIVSSDLTIRSLVNGEQPALGDASPARVQSLLDALARVPAGGATDLGAALTAGAALLDPTHEGALIYVGDGAPTVGELASQGLLSRLDRLPHPVRLYAIAVGSDANLDLLSALTRGGGLAVRVEERAQAADVALTILAHTSRPVAHNVRVQIAGVDNVYPRPPSSESQSGMDAVLGEVYPIVGRVAGDVPSHVHVSGTVLGHPFQQDIPITVAGTEESTDLRLRWAQERLRQMLLAGGQREEIVDLGTRYGLITPYTSYYVPSRRELAAMGQTSWLVDRPLLEVARRAERPTTNPFLVLALGPLGMSGCANRSEPSRAQEIPLDLPRADPQGVVPTPSTTPPAFTGEPSLDDATPVAGNVDTSGSMGWGQRAAEEPPSPTAPAAQAAPAPIVAMPPRTEGGDFEARLGPMPGSGGAANMPSAHRARATSEIIDPFAGAEQTENERAVHGDVSARESNVSGGLSREPIARVVRMHLAQVRACYERQLRLRPDLQGTITVRLTIGANGAVQSSDIASSTMGDPSTESCIATAARSWRFPAAQDGASTTVVYPFSFTPSDREASNGTTNITITQVIYVQDPAAHQARRCSDAADQSLEDRKVLWRERLGASGSPAGWVHEYREAIRNCEAETWRDRRAFLGLVLAQAGGVSSMIDVYRLLDEGSARGFLRGEILRRVRSPDDLRMVRDAFGLGRDPDWTLVEQILGRAHDAAGRVRALRALVEQYPDSSELKLRLLAQLEEAGRTGELLRLAEQMRIDPLADAGVRTAIGELYLRMNRVDDAGRVFSEIVEFAPLDELARRRLGDLYRAHGWFEPAYRQYLTLREIRPDDLEVQLLLAQAAAGAGRVDEAIRLERQVMQSAQPGASEGVAHTALLWSSVRFARMTKAASDAHDQTHLTELISRMRSSGVLRDAGVMRVSLTWSHPDAQVSLWASYPGLNLERATDIAPELGIEAFDVQDAQDGVFRIEVRRAGDDRTDVQAQLVVVWNEGRTNEKVEIVDLEFDRGRRAYAWTIQGQGISEAAISEAAQRGIQ